MPLSKRAVLMLCSLSFITIILAGCPSDPDENAAVDADDHHDVNASDDVDQAAVDLELTEFSPDSGPIEGGTAVTLTGQGFLEGMTVFFGDEEATQVTHHGGSSAVAITPSVDEARVVDLILENDDGSRVVRKDAFTFELNDEQQNQENQQNQDSVVRPESCGVQFPILVESTLVGEEVSLYGRIYEPGVTDQVDLTPSLLAEALVGPVGADPAEDIGLFTVLAAERTPVYVSDDFEEFKITFTPNEAGEYAFLYRFSLDDGEHWTYCDIAGARAPQEVVPGRFAAIFVFDEAPILVDSCHTLETELSGSEGADGPLITVAAYQGGITDTLDPADGEALQAQAGFGPEFANPSLGYSWREIDFSQLATDPPNHYEYEGILFKADDAPDAGSYQAITRVRLPGSDAWSYCSTNPGQANFSLEGAATLSVEP